MATVTNKQLVKSALRNIEKYPNGGWRCFSEDPELQGCVYQHPEQPELGCFIGQALIDLGLMTPGIAGYMGGVTTLIETRHITKESFENLEFAASFQDIHDNATSDNEDVDVEAVRDIKALCREFEVQYDFPE